MSTVVQESLYIIDSKWKTRNTTEVVFDTNCVFGGRKGMKVEEKRAMVFSDSQKNGDLCWI